MLKKLTIRNFKAIEDMTIEFSPLTVLIGGNGCGKSTVLQALDFLRSAATMDFSVITEQNSWYWPDLKSQLDDNNKDKPIEFISEWEFADGENTDRVNWSLAIDNSNDEWKVSEKLDTNKYQDAKIVLDTINGEYNPELLGKTRVQSSAIKVIGFPKSEIYSQLQVFLYSSRNFGLLSPEKMRMPSKNNVNSIGLQGKSLAAFVHKMPDDKKQELNALISDLLGIKISIKTLEDTGFGVILLAVAEHFSKTTHIDSSYISDGLLRIIAFAAIKLEIESLVRLDFGGVVVHNPDGNVMAEKIIPVRHGYILLDEIENGINPYLTERIIGLLREIVEKSGRQVVITTHSPIILNDVSPDDIRLFWKDQFGSVHCRKLFSIAELRDSLDFLYPGDALMNMPEAELLAKASSGAGENK